MLLQRVCPLLALAWALACTRTCRAASRAPVHSHAAVAGQPHIMMLLVDDLGHNDVGWKNPQISTPTLTSLAKQGIQLGHHYVFKYCSPTRASFLTGRLPYHAHQWNLDEHSPWGTSLNMTFLSAKLKGVGYSTHMIGKWGVGFFAPEYLPTSRGFDTSSGFLGSGEDHFNQRSDGAGCAVDFWKNQGPDHRNGTYDAWVYRDDIETLFRSRREREMLNESEARTRTAVGGEMLPASAVATEPPMFLFMAFHNVHSPLQAPQWLIDKQDPSLCTTRRTLHAMVEAVDNVTTVLMAHLKQNDMYKDTVIVFSADNGGAPGVGSNYPLRGCKSTFFEGGVRSVAFVHSPLLPAATRGTLVDGLVHICDWYATFASLAGYEPSDSGAGRYDTDSINMWPLLRGNTTQSPRQEVVIGFNFTHSHPLQGAIIVGRYCPVRV